MARHPNPGLVVECDNAYCGEKTEAARTWGGWLWVIDSSTSPAIQSRWLCFCSWGCLVDYGMDER